MGIPGGLGMPGGLAPAISVGAPGFHEPLPLPMEDDDRSRKSKGLSFAKFSTKFKAIAKFKSMARRGQPTNMGGMLGDGDEDSEGGMGLLR
jgi:hypothetical protein